MSRDGLFGLARPEPRFVAWWRDQRGKWFACGSGDDREELRKAVGPEAVILRYRERPYSSRADAMSREAS